MWLGSIYNEMLSTAAFIAWLLLPVLAWVLRKRLPGVMKHVALLFPVAVIAGTLLYIGGIWLVGAELEGELYKFDLNGDLEFSESEMTPAAEEAMHRFTSDAGRTLAPFVAGPVTFVWVAFWWLLLAGVAWAIDTVRERMNQRAQASL